jgi:hypothetical protein
MTSLLGQGTQGRQRLCLALVLTIVCMLAAAAPSAPAAPSLKTGFIAFEYVSSDTALRNQWFDATVQANADIVRIPADWRGNVGNQPPANPRDPSDPAYNFFGLDRIVRDAQARGLEVMFTIAFAPDWAEGPNRPPDAPSGTWNPDPKAYGDYAHALATRYSGSFPDPAAGGQPLPRVSLYEVWNEPNLDEFLGPQWNGGPSSPALYGQLLNSLYDGVKSVHPDNRVIGPALAPYGDPPGGSRMRPLKFLRELFCLKGKKEPRPNKGCSNAEIPRLDILSHHPINLVGSPPNHAEHPDDVTSGDLDRVKRVLRAAEKAGNVKPRGRRPLWVTEFFWYSNPPTTGFDFARPPEVQARFIEQSLYLWWREGAEVAVNFLIRDMTSSTGLIFGTGVFFNDGVPKPAFDAFRFPFVVDRKSKRKVLVWGKAPATGELEVQREEAGGWNTVKRLSVDDGAVFTTRLRIRGGATLRGVVGSDASLPWGFGG